MTLCKVVVQVGEGEDAFSAGVELDVDTPQEDPRKVAMLAVNRCSMPFAASMGLSNSELFALMEEQMGGIFDELRKHMGGGDTP